MQKITHAQVAQKKIAEALELLKFNDPDPFAPLTELVNRTQKEQNPQPVTYDRNAIAIFASGKAEAGPFETAQLVVSLNHILGLARNDGL